MNKLKLALLGLLAAFGLNLMSCSDDDDDTISTVNFEEGIYNLTTNDLSPFEVTLAITPAARTDSEITIEFSGADPGVVFNTDPAISGNTLVVPVPSGANFVSFTFTPIEAGIQGNVVIDLDLVSAGEGLTTGINIESIITVVDVGVNLPLTEEFEGCQEDPQQPIPDGWTEAVIEQNAEGSAVWQCVDEGFFGFNAVVVNAFVPNSSDASPSEVWLITPRLNLTETTNPILNFDVDRRFPGTGNFPEDLYDILISTDFSVSVEDATWTRFEPGFEAMTANDPGADGLTNTGDLDLSAFNGDVIAIAFVYRAGGPSTFDATILRIANVSVTDN